MTDLTAYGIIPSNSSYRDLGNCFNISQPEYQSKVSDFQHYCNDRYFDEEGLNAYFIENCHFK